jgi:lysophospholipase L1-like esterase
MLKPVRNEAKVLLKTFILISFFIPAYHHLNAQSDYPFDIRFYEFIQYDKNVIHFPGDSADFSRVFFKMDSVILQGEGKICIVHIGGSHVQADVYPGRMRQRLQAFYPGMNGGRGSVFPYRMSQTNNPSSYKATYTNDWTTCRNVELNKSCDIGLSGITASTANPGAKIRISLRENDKTPNSFNIVRIFHSFGQHSFLPHLDSMNVARTEMFPELGYSLFYLGQDYNNMSLGLSKNDSLQYTFQLYGISLENDDPGFIYHSMGINGASLNSFLRCNLLEKHLQALKPDMVIVSLGTNDAYTTKFKPDVYRSNYELMLNRIKRVAPKAAIICTVANDSYLFRRYPNKNTQLAAGVIYEVAGKYHCGVWDFYEIMGGFNSSKLWQKQNLMGRDLVHFNQEGYLLKGDLFFNAFIRSYDNHLIRSKTHKPY